MEKETLYPERTASKGCAVRQGFEYVRRVVAFMVKMKKI
jgi:hypothetical protein